MEKERVEVPERTHDQPAEGGREQADRALEHQEEDAGDSGKTRPQGEPGDR